MKVVDITISDTRLEVVGRVRAKIRGIGPTVTVEGRKVREVTFDLKCDTGGRRLTVLVPAHLRGFALVLEEARPDFVGFYDCRVGLRPSAQTFWAMPGVASTS